jgi:DNA-binding GntR family transcriptional regulator
MEVAREFETSQGPVREAFAQLRQEGFLISFPRRGTFVTRVSEEEARTAYEIRKLVEPYVMERAIERMADEDVRAFARDLEVMRAAASVRDYRELVAADMRFHGRFYELSGSPLAAAIWTRIESTVRQFVAITDTRLYGDEERFWLADMHEPLVQLLEARDAVGLSVELQRQIAALWERIGTGEEPDEGPDPADAREVASS